MPDHLIDQLREEFPDLDEFLGELWLRWPEIDRRRRLSRSTAERWDILVAEARRARREVYGEGRPSNTVYLEDMDQFSTDERLP